ETLYSVVQGKGNLDGYATSRLRSLLEISIRNGYPVGILVDAVTLRYPLKIARAASKKNISTSISAVAHTNDAFKETPARDCNGLTASVVAREFVPEICAYRFVSPRRLVLPFELTLEDHEQHPRVVGFFEIETLPTLGVVFTLGVIFESSNRGYKGIVAGSTLQIIPYGSYFCYDGADGLPEDKYARLKRQGEARNLVWKIVMKAEDPREDVPMHAKFSVIAFRSLDVSLDVSLTETETWGEPGEKTVNHRSSLAKQ
ncbi:hypothetical protein V1477_007554, partial [Vespula maculifrons]